MSVQINFNNFKIDRMNYASEDIESNKLSNIELNITDTIINISDDKSTARISITGNIKEISEDNNIIRSLNLSASYYYSLLNVENDDSFVEVQHYLEDYGINTSVVMYEELIKQITSIDYNGPIVLNGFVMPGSVKKDD